MTAARRRFVTLLVAGLGQVTLARIATGQPDHSSAMHASATSPISSGRAPPSASSDTVSIDCVGCHAAVHGRTYRADLQQSSTCIACHPRAHQAILTLFSGANPALRPDRMYRARVGCRSCHSDAAMNSTGAERRLIAIQQACASCHGSGYAMMLPRWNDALMARNQAVAAYLAAASAESQLVRRSGAGAQLASARADMTLLRDGVGLHNVPAADALLRSAVRKVGSAYRDAGVPIPPPPPLGPDPATVSCAYCHYGIEGASATTFGETFRHADHVLRADVACSQCHSSADYFATSTRRFDPRHGKTTVTAAACGTCHHVTSALTCTRCHDSRGLAQRTSPVTIPLRLRPAGAPTSRAVAFAHGPHATIDCQRCHTSRTAIATAVACTTCHVAHHREARDCTGCHGTKLLAAHTAADHLTCARCHETAALELLTGDRTFCLSCHVGLREHQPGRECATCHLQMSPAEVQAAILGRRP